MGPLARFDRFQQRHRTLAIPCAVARKFVDDGGGDLAATIAYRGFFSLFPMLLVFVTVLGYALHGHPHAIHSVEHTVLTNFPGLGRALQFGTLRGSAAALLVGGATALWFGLAFTDAAQRALDTVWAVPTRQRPGFLASKLLGVAWLVCLGVLFTVATALSGAATSGLGGPLTTPAGIVASLLVNVILFFAAFRLMTAESVPTRALRTGVLAAAVAWTILQVVGGLYVGHVLRHLSSLYASFGVVLSLLVWLHLGAQVTLFAAELGVVVERRMWPRSLLSGSAAA